MRLILRWIIKKTLLLTQIIDYMRKFVSDFAIIGKEEDDLMNILNKSTIEVFSSGSYIFKTGRIF